jgi:hypothetical protein
LLVTNYVGASKILPKGSQAESLLAQLHWNQWFPNFFGPPLPWIHKLIPSAPCPTL